MGFLDLGNSPASSRLVSLNAAAVNHLEMSRTGCQLQLSGEEKSTCRFFPEIWTVLSHFPLQFLPSHPIRDRLII